MSANNWRFNNSIAEEKKEVSDAIAYKKEEKEHIQMRLLYLLQINTIQEE